MRYFIENHKRIITRDELLNSHIWDNSVARADNQENGKAFDMAIARLRRTIEVDPKKPETIETVHGKGWALSKDAILQ